MLAVLLIPAYLYLVQSDWLNRRLIPAGSDTPLIFYPYAKALHEALQAGRLPLWEPRLFGGFPLLAEGEIGALFPLNWFLFGSLSLADGMIWQPFCRLTLAGIGMYAFARALKLSPLAALAAGLAFPHIGFMLQQEAPLNSAYSTAMLPWALAGFEWALRTRGWRRGLTLAVGAVGVAGAALGIYAQILLLNLTLLGLYALFRCLFPPEWDGQPLRRRQRQGEPPPAKQPWWPGFRRNLLVALRRTGRTLLIALAVVGLGLGLAAPQLLPLAELSGLSGRAGGLSYEYAAAFSGEPDLTLTGLLVPRLLEPYQTPFFVGAITLALALFALVFRRDRFVIFFTLLGVLALLVAIGPSLSLNLHYWLWQLPGYNQLRAPVRFTFLTQFGLTILAALGLQWARDHFKSRPMLAPAPVAVGPEPWSVALAVAPLPLIPLLAQVGFNPDDFQRLLQSWGLFNLDLWLVLMLVGVAGGLLAIWWQAARWPRLWMSLLVGLLALNSAQFALTARPGLAYDHIARNQNETSTLYLFDRPNIPLTASGQPAVFDFLRQTSGGYRVLSGTSNAVGIPTETATGPNRLLGIGVAEAGGYSPLQMTRHARYLSAAQRLPNALLALLGVRYVVADRYAAPVGVYNEVAYDLSTSLANVPNVNPTEPLIVPDVPTTELRLAARLNDAADRYQGETVATLVVVTDRGQERRLPIRAGIEVADQRFGLHRTVEAIPINGWALFYGRLPLTAPGEPPLVVRQLRFEPPSVNPGRLEVYGLALVGDDGLATQVRLPLALRFADSLAYQDEYARVWENPAALPRAMLVPRAERVDDPIAALARLARPDFDPHRLVLVEGAAPELPTDSPEGVAGSVELVVDQPERLELRVTTDQPAILLLADTYYPGWQATLDGQPVPIRRADTLFRAVGVPAGQHVVRLVYDPPSFQTGLTLARASAAVLAAGVALPPLWAGAWWTGRRRGAAGPLPPTPSPKGEGES